MARARRKSAVYNPRYQEIIRLVREARHEAGLTQSEVAERLGRPLSFVSKVELGERRIDAAELEEFAEIYGKDIRYFYPIRSRAKRTTPPAKKP